MNDHHGRLADVVEFSCVDGPGNRFVVFLQGCNFECIACHNPQTIASRSRLAHDVSVGDLVERIAPLAGYLSGITVSGGEATVQASFVHSLFTRVRADPRTDRLTRFIDSNGNAPAATWERLLPVTDGVMVDLKALDPAVHDRLTGRPNDVVLRSIELLAAADRLHEVRLLLVPSLNDDRDTIERTADWLVARAPGVRVKIIGFRTHGTLPPAACWTDEPIERVEDAASVFVDRGFLDVVIV